MSARILIVGNGDAAEQLRDRLPAATQLVALRAADACVRLRDRAADLLIVVLDESWQEGMRQLAQLRQEAFAAAVPVLALVPRNNPEALVRAFDMGVADCAGLPLDAHEASARIGALLRRKSQADRLTAEARDARHRANTDSVTGLFNRYYLDEQLAAAIAAARKRGSPLTLLMLDIDAFKPVNDRFGHAAGDRALRAVAARLSANVRAIDTIVRYGGDELVVMMPDTDIPTARRIAERLRSIVGETPVPGADGSADSMQVTVSIGMAALEARDSDGAALLARADAALFAAKRAGRNRVEAAISAA